MKVDAPLPPVGSEALDQRCLDDGLARVTLREIARTNVLFGGHRALLYGLRALRREAGPAPWARVLDVGAGDGQATDQVRQVCGNGTVLVGLDHHRSAARLCQGRGVVPLVGDMWHLPLAPNSVDVVIASLVLHHVPRAHASLLIERLDAAARIGVVLTDLRRSSLANAGFAVASRALGFHAVTRQDGHTSIRRGFHRIELASLVQAAGVRHATVCRRPGWRLVAYWRKHHAHG